MKLAHRRIRHTSVTAWRITHDTKAIYGFDALGSAKHVENVCEACVDGKAPNAPHKRCEKTTIRVCDLKHTDIAGPISPVEMDSEQYSQILVDD